ncbi:MAG: DNA-processing protein DprA [Selenomonadaceae bacterium]|nr:DNA-processing protein DprA [Selenomonadaceae bacterium]
MDKYFVASIAGANSLGNRRVKRLVEFFGNGRAAWEAEVADLKNSGLPSASIESFIEWRNSHPDAPDRLSDYCERKGFGLCTIFDEDYPPILKEISLPPVLFYYRGKISRDAERVGIVGTRNNTPYGKNVAQELGRKLAAAGLTIVSGAARGIDTFAHTGALETGRTVAVLGQGLSARCSREKKKLLDQIAENGLVMSEFSLKTEANEGTFPTRNRIISGLCRTVIVVEAGEKSGALLTSEFAAMDSREVLVVPGNVYSEKSIGCHNLIRDGATLIKNAQDVLEYYNLDVPKKISVPPSENAIRNEESGIRNDIAVNNSKLQLKPPPANLSDKAAKIFELIPAGDFITGDEILNVTDEISPHELPKIILELEIKNCVVEDAGRYTRKSN